MKRIGVLISSTDCSKYLFETVSELSGSDQIELFFLLSEGGMAKQNIWRRISYKIESMGLKRVIDLAFFKLIAYLERTILSVLFPKIREHNRGYNLDEFVKNESVRLSPVFSTSGLVVRFSDQDIASIKSLDLDLIIRGNAEGIFKGEILNVSKKGIISFHHGDNRWNRGGPPAFWEVYFRKPSTGFIIQLLTEELDGGSVLFRGEIPTCRSYTENLASIYSESNPYLLKLVLDFVSSDRLPTPEDKFPFGDPVLRSPSLRKSIVYLLRTVFVFLSFVINRKVLGKEDRWGVAFIAGSWRTASLNKGVQIKNLPNRYFADPFVVTVDERTVCYVEDYDRRIDRARISAIEIVDDTRYEVLGPVIEEPFHMSFPFLFKYKNDLYMIPESGQSNSIRLYKCTQYPMKWVYQNDLISNVNAVDSMVFEYERNWWLLTNIASNGNSDYCSKLFAYYSSHPLSDEWIAHEGNPLVFDSNLGRNGGILDVDNKSPFRVRQKQGFDSYGNSLTIAKIVELTSSSFRENKIAQVLPSFFPNLKGCHHISSNGEYTVYDYRRLQSFK